MVGNKNLLYYNAQLLSATYGIYAVPFKNEIKISRFPQQYSLYILAIPWFKSPRDSSYCGSRCL